MRAEIDAGYRPTEDEPFMNDRQRELFRRRLLVWRDDILKDAEELDQGSGEMDQEVASRQRDRQCKLIAMIDAALQRIEDGTYGYCEETGKPIPLKRLEARPIARLANPPDERCLF